MGQHDFEGEYWNTDAKTLAITRLQFLGRSCVSAWGSCFPEDCSWGETDLHLLKDEGAKSGVQQAFATWGADSEPTHCLMTLIEDVLIVIEISIHSQSPSYKLTETFRQDASRSLEAKNPDPLKKFKHMWDGSELGWKLIRYPHQVSQVELIFDESGPTRSEFPTVVDFVGTFPDESEDQMWKRLRGCSGVSIARPLGPTEMDRLRARQRENNLNLTVCTMDPGDYLVLTPDGDHFCWMALPSYRRPVIERMINAGVPVVLGQLE